MLLSQAGPQIQRGAGVRVPPPDVLMEDVDQRVRWKPAPILAQEGPALSPFMEVPMEVEEEGAVTAQEYGSMVE